MTRILLACLWFVIAGWCLSMGWRVLYPALRPQAQTLHLGPTTGETVRYVDADGRGVILRWTTGTELYRKGPAKEDR